jgi:restriction endonuclease S subunit
MKLEDIVTVKVGRNLSRGNEMHNQSYETYSYQDLMHDLDGLFPDSTSCIHNENAREKASYLSSSGEVVFSFVSSKAAIVSDVNKGKMMNQNFAKLIIEHKQLDHSYLCYVLNESHAMKRQMEISMQGSTVRKLTPAILKSLDMKLPDMGKQQTIGKAYLKLKKRQALARKQADLEAMLYLEVLKQLDQS